jgi:hypothetical protein
VPRGPRVSFSLLRERKPLRKLTCLCPLGRGNPSPFPCSSLHRPPAKFQPRCWPLSSRIVPSHCCRHRCASVLPLLHWEPPRCHRQGAGKQVLGRVAASSLLVRAWTPFRPGRSLPFRAPRQRVLACPCAPHGCIASLPCPARLANDVWTKHHLTCPSRSSQAVAAPRARVHTMQRAVVQSHPVHKCTFASCDARLYKETPPLHCVHANASCPPLLSRRRAPRFPVCCGRRGQLFSLPLPPSA